MTPSYRDTAEYLAAPEPEVAPHYPDVRLGEHVVVSAVEQDPVLPGESLPLAFAELPGTGSAQRLVRLVVPADVAPHFDVSEIRHVRYTPFAGGADEVPGVFWHPTADSPPILLLTPGAPVLLRVRNTSKRARPFRALLAEASLLAAPMSHRDYEQAVAGLSTALVLESENCATLQPGETVTVWAESMVPLDVQRLQLPQDSPLVVRKRDPWGPVAAGCAWSAVLENAGTSPARAVAIAWGRDRTRHAPTSPLVHLAGHGAAVLRVDEEGLVLARCRDCGKEGPLVLDAELERALERLVDRTRMG